MISPTKDSAPAQAGISRIKLLLLAAASGMMIANAYYIHPLVDPVSAHFGIGPAEIGLTPALNQVALALGILFLLPLGDLVSNRRLVIASVSAQFVMVTGMAFAPSYPLFLTASTLLGFFTIAPYVLPAYVSRRVPPSMLGEVNGILTTGVIVGILLARGSAGVIGEYFSWQTMYWIASAMMLITAMSMPVIMRNMPPLVAAQNTDDVTDKSRRSYGALLASLWPLAKARPAMLLSCLVQALNFSIFITVWLGLALHLPSAEMGYGIDVIGYLSMLAIINLFTTTKLGRWADRLGADKARFYVAIIQFTAICTLPWSGYSIWLLIPVLLTTNIAGPIIDIAGRMTLLQEEAGIRTRLMTIYIVAMFTGGGFGSLAGTSAYAFGGWHAVSMLATAISGGVLTLSWWMRRRHRLLNTQA